jgi:Bacterial aa3 type cytochrome c oxidase subunit IV
MAGNADQDLEAHRETWNLFVRLMIFSIVGVVGVLTWMALFLT